MKRYHGQIIDVDVHHRPRNPGEIYAYLPKRWAGYAQQEGHASFPLAPPATMVGLGTGAARLDAWGEDGAPPGSSYERLCEQLLDRHNYARAILTHQLGDYAAHANH
jgi:hypothetical protein